MKTPFKTLLSLLLLLTLPAVVKAQFNYTNNGNGTCTIALYTCSDGRVSIPGSVDGLPVVSIRYEAFWDNYALTSITIPTSVTGIGSESLVLQRP